MSSDVALRIEGLGKKYTIRHKDHDHVTLAQAALHRIRHPRGAVGKEEFWALRDVSLEVPRGQVLGVIGHNGAGKSTLLKILSRITPPTTGRVEVFGRIGSLLEVGTGFHPELTGRENIYLNGSILGMRTKEIDRQFDAIVDFSGVEKFLDTPVKRYSSGMYVRLAFAVAAHLDTEILLMDEVLAVGDAEFQKKCLGKMGEVAKSGRTVVFVSHNFGAVNAICEQAAWMAAGTLRHSGSTASCIAKYIDESEPTPSARDLRDAPRPTWAMTGYVRLTSASVAPVIEDGKVRHLALDISIERSGPVRTIALHVIFRSRSGHPVAVADFDDISVPGAAVNLRCRIHQVDFRPGVYSVTIAATTPNPRFGYTDHDCIDDCIGLDLSTVQSESAGVPASWGDVRLRGDYEVV
jgi:ABC-type polysaccharide/polyol phosphate transport system ATPase subunit